MLLLVFWSAIIALADYVVVTTSLKQARARRYVPVAARIVESEIGHGAIIRSGVIFEYNYTVNGLEYTGHRYRYDDRNSAYEYAETTNTYPRWSQATVYYNPADPSDSIMNPGIDGSDLLLLLLAMPLNIVTLALWVANLQPKNNAGLPAGGVQLLTSETETRARLTPFSPAGAGWFALAAGCFGSVFPLVSFCGFSPPLHVMLGMWWFVAGLGAAGYLWMRQREMAGYYDLRIERGAGAVTLPRLAPGERAVTLAKNEISGVCLLRRTTRNPSGIHETFLPALDWKGAGLPAQALKIVRWGWDEEKARAFALWLSQELEVEFKGTAGPPDQTP